ncbi:hypothetical protein CN090_04410 [Sinorhizobium meliloti]|uniref:hypothetical protein n=1 Tax=Rhizobium meliloti TaxID=382 RepID=UPI000FD86D57|nr:hypothetical protein [Sinorhizobium meliloti]RVO55165.1 hypothetical protein CN090_04410 [Sinorhizobium meliloti]
MDERRRRDRLEQANVRVEKFIWLPGAVAAMTVPEDLKEAIVEDLYGDGADNSQVISKIPGISSLLSDDDEPEEDYIIEILANADGFLAQLATPVPTSFYGDSGYAFSWGYYRTKWVHADSLDELTALAEAFGEEVVASARAKLGAAA